MNKTLNIRIVELLSKEKRTSINFLYFLTHTTGNEHKEAKMKITTNKSGKILICEKPIAFNIESQLNNTIYMNFKRHRFIISDDLIGEVVLPLNWFPSNHIVREWFPIVTKNNGHSGGMVLLDIHVDCRGADPFMAPFAHLNIRPTWRNPELNENAEVFVNHNLHDGNEINTNNFIPKVPPQSFYPGYQVPIIYNNMVDWNANNQFGQKMNDCQNDNQKMQSDLKNIDDEYLPQLQNNQQPVLYPQLQNNFQQPEFYPQITQNANPYSNC